MAQTAENRQKLAKIGPLDPSFYFFAPVPWRKSVQTFSPKTTEVSAVREKIRYSADHENVVKKIAKLGTGHFPI